VSENICNSSGGGQETKERRGQNKMKTQFGTKSARCISEFDPAPSF
jgi:hypothetical protein